MVMFVAVTSPTFAGEIHDAALAGDGEAVARLLENGVDVDEPGEAEGTALHLAAYAGHLPVAELLLERGAGLEYKAGPGRTALHLAAMKGHAEIVQALLDRGAQVDPIDHELVTPLGLAVSSCDLAVVQLLIEHGADVNKRFFDHATILHGLPYADHPDRHGEMAALLIGAGVDVNAATKNERNTPLHTAAMFGDYDMVEQLLEAGAAADGANRYNDRPLHSAAVTGQARIAALLLEHGVQVDVADASGMTALHWAAGRGKRTKGRSMHDYVTWRRGGKPIPQDYVRTAKLLIEHGASLEKRDHKGRTPSKIAKKRGDQKMIALLKGQAP